MERCIRCDGEMEEGFVIDKGDYNFASQAQWASGGPETSFWGIAYDAVEFTP